MKKTTKAKKPATKAKKSAPKKTSNQKKFEELTTSIFNVLNDFGKKYPSDDVDELILESLLVSASQAADYLGLDLEDMLGVTCSIAEQFLPDEHICEECQKENEKVENVSKKELN